MCEECEYDLEHEVEAVEEAEPRQDPLRMTRFVLTVLRDRPTLNVLQIKELAKVFGLELSASALFDAAVVHRTAKSVLGR